MVTAVACVAVLYEMPHDGRGVRDMKIKFSGVPLDAPMYPDDALLDGPR